MAKGNKITRKDLVEDKVFSIGKDYEKSLDPAIKANEDWIKSFGPIKELILEYNKIEGQYKFANGRKEFLEIKAKEVDLQKKTTDALKKEQELFIKMESVVNKKLQNEAKLIDIANKKLTLANKEEAAQKRKIKLTDQERIEMQQRNREARLIATISSSLSTAYEKESARLLLLTRRYKGVAVEQGKGSKEAKKLEKELNDLRNKLYEVDKAAGNFQKNVGNYPRSLGGAVKSIKSLASAAGLLGGGFLAIQVARDAFKTIVDFDRQLIAVQKTTNLTDDEIKQFSKDVVKLGLDLDGISTQNLLKSSEIAGQLGIKGSKNILKFAETIEKLSLTSDIAGEESAQNFAKFIEVSSDTVENADRLGSVITEMGNNFATTESQVLSNATEIQKGIAIYNTSAQSVIALGAATNALGSEAEASRGALQTTFKILNDGATKGENLEKILKLTGQTASEFKEEFGRDAVAVFQKFVKGLSDSEKEGENLSNTLEGLGITEKRATAVVGSLAKNYDTLEDALNRANQEYVENEALNSEAQKATESLSSKIGDLGDTWDNLVLTIDSGDGTISKVFSGLVDYINKALDALIYFNRTAEEQGQQFGDERYKKTFKELTEFYKEAGDSAEDLAIKEADRARDTIDNINAQIQALKDENKQLNENSIGWGKTYTEKKNDETIKGLTADLGYYKAVLDASESVIYQTDDAQKNLNNTFDDAEVSTERNVKRIKELITAEKQRLELSTNRDEAKAVQANIDALEKELQAILGVNDAAKKRSDLFKQDNFNFKKAQLESEASANKEILDNEKSTLAEKQIANLRYYDAKEALLQLQRDFELSEAKGRSDKLAEIQLKYNDDTLELERQREANALKLLEQHYNNELKLIQEAEQKKKDALNAEIGQAQTTFNNSAQTPQDVEAYEKAVADIRKRYALETVQAQIDAVKELQQDKELTTEQQAELARMLSELEIEYSNISTEQAIENANLRAEKEKEIAERIAQFKAEKIAEASNVIAEALNLDANNVERLFTAFTTKAEETGDAVIDKYNKVANTLEKVGAVASVAGDIVDAVFQANIDKIDEEIEKSDEKYERWLENENLTEEQRSELEAKKEQERQELEKKKNKEKTKQAIADKALAVTQVGISTALGIMQAYAQLGPIGGSLGAALVAALGAIQIAAIIAKPIPKYAKGTEWHKGGYAVVGEERPEVVREPGKDPYIVSEPSVLNLPTGTKVTPSLEEYENLMRASILSSVDISNNKLDDFESSQSFNKHNKELIEELRLNRRAIEKQKTHIHVHERKIDIDHAIWRSNNIKWD